MAKEKLVKNITPRDVDFAQWYTDVIREAQLCDYSSVKGCLNYLPNSLSAKHAICSAVPATFRRLPTSTFCILRLFVFLVYTDSCSMHPTTSQY